MAYSNLMNGSSGEDVKKLQTALINAGYDVGSTGADGQYGAATRAAVVKYQQDHGLDIDGVAGNQTQTSLYGNGEQNTAVTQVPAVNATQGAAADAGGAAPSISQSYAQAITALMAAAKAPTAPTGYGAQLNDIYNQIVNRPKFQYDINADQLYQQYAQDYANRGRLAMQDAIGQAAYLTGGYDNSYAQTVGQQQYNAYLERLNDVVPDLYSQAYGQYRDDGDDLMQRYSILAAMDDRDYDRYQDEFNRYLNVLNFVQPEAKAEEAAAAAAAAGNGGGGYYAVPYPAQEEAAPTFFDKVYGMTQSVPEKGTKEGGPKMLPAEAVNIQKVGSAQGEAIVWNNKTYRTTGDGMNQLVNDINAANLSQSQIDAISERLRQLGASVN